MFGNRRLKLILIPALILALALLTGAGAAEEIQAPAESRTPETSYNLQQADPRLTYRSGGDKVDSIDGANSLTLLFFASADNPLPQGTDTVMYYDLPRNVAAGDLKELDTDTVSMEYDEQLNRLYFRWKTSGGGNAFSVTLPVVKRQPFYTVNHILRLEDGNEKVYLSETKPFISGMLIREAPIDIEGYEGENAPYETEKRTDYEDVVNFYYHRIELHYQVEYLAIDGTVLRPRSVHSGYYGDMIEPPEEVNGYRFVYCDQGETPIPLTQDNQYISLRYSTGSAGWMPADQGTQDPADLSFVSDYIVRHVIPAEFTYIGQDVVLKTSAGKAGNPILEQAEQFDGKYYCDQSRTQITDTGVTFYYRPVQLSVQLNYVEGYMGANGPERTDPKSQALKEPKTLALWYGQDYNLNYDVERQFIAGGVEYTFIGTDNVNRDLMYHGTEDNRVYNLYYVPSVAQSGQATYQVTWKNWDGVVLETDQGVVAGESPSYNSITPIRPADEASMYEFAGWDPVPSTVSGNAEYTAVFNPIPRQYGVRFVDDSGNEIKLENLTYGTMPAAQAPEKEGTAEFLYRFTGWNPELAPVTGDATYMAVYEQERRQYTVRFTDDEGNELFAAPYYYGTLPADITQPAMPQKESTAEYNYTFSHWEPTIAEVTGDAVYKAVFAENKRPYQITWTDENGKVLDSQAMEYGAVPEHEAITKPETKESVFVFAGWDPEPAPVKEDVTYKAVFETQKKKYPITWRDEAGRDIETTEEEYGSVPSHEDPEKEPNERNVYEFRGWQPRLREVTGPAAYKATYTTKPREYTIRFLTEDGGEISAASYRYGTQRGRINVPRAPEKEATEQTVYEFAGWEPAVEDVKADADYTAVYTESQRTYRIVWQDDTGALLGSMDLPWGEMPEVPVPEKAATDEFSYDFAGWDPAMAEVTGEAVYTATFTAKPREYIVRFVDDNGGEISSAGYRMGTPAEEITRPETPVKPETAEYTYTFAGWIPEIAPVSGDATYQASFASVKRQYTIRFTDENGETLSEIPLEYGTPASAVPGPAVPAREATEEFSYTFAGWEPTVTDVTGDAVYKAVFTPVRNQYRVTWLLDDGSTIDVTAAEYGTVPVHADPVKPDTPEFTYTFAGWTPEIATVTGNATYQAVFEAEKRVYTLRFTGEDGQELSTGVYPYGTPAEEIEQPVVPEKEPTARFVFNFAGWKPELSEVTRDADYQAVYERADREYTVRFLNDDGSEISSAAYPYDTPARKIAVPDDPVKEATETAEYTFTGWNGRIANVRQDADYTAVYREDRIYTVRFTDEDGTEISSAKYKAGTPANQVSVPEDPQKEAAENAVYTFTGWDKPVAAVEEDAVYTAVYREIPIYTIRFVNDDGAEIASARYTAGTPANQVSVPEDPQKEATENAVYTFMGWDKPVAAVEEDAVYTAVYRETPICTIRFVNDDGTEITSAKYQAGTPANQVSVPGNPVKEPTESVIYTFAGWDKPITPVEGDAVYTATYREELRQYTVRFTDEEGMELSAALYPYGTPVENIAVPQAPQREATAEYAYTFAGWEPEVAAVTGDITYRAVYNAEKRSYMVLFVNDDGEQLAAAAYEYGTPPERIALPDIPVKAATEEYSYTFIGWTPAIADVTEDASYKAVYSAEKRSYTVRFLTAEGEEITAASYEYGTPADGIEIPEVKAPEATAEYSYAFTGWEPAVVAVTGDAEYRAVNTATKRQYTVRFTGEDGQPLAEAATYEYGTPAEDVRVPAAPQKQGNAEFTYTFAGWEPAIADVTGDATYKAVFEAAKNRYRVTWIPDNGAEPETQELEYGAEPAHEPVAREATPEYTYTFTGWEPEIAPVTGDVTYQAVYTAQKQTYTVRFLDGTGEEIVSASYEYGTAPEAMQIPEPQQTIETEESVYTFARWQPAVEPVTGDAAYQAAYSVAPRPYVLHFVDAGGNELAAVEYPYGTAADMIQAPQAPAPEPTAEEVMTFTGWEPKIADVTGEATYRAVYTAQPRPYTVRFLGDGGAVISEAVYPYGTEAEEILLPETAPEKPATAEYSYTFIGWEPGLETVTGNRDYQAIFDAEKNKVRIRWENDDGSEIDTTEVEYGEMPEHAPAQKEATPEFTYLFKNWNPRIKPAKEETAYRAVFDKAQRHYTVRFLDAEGSQLTENSYRYGVQARNLKVPKAPEKAADEQYIYTFAGWEPELSDVTENAEYRPTYRETLRQYEVRFVNDDGRVVSAASYDYGTAAADVAIPGAPEKAPTQESTFTFTGWEPEIADVTGEAEYRAVYEAEKRSYTVRFLGADGEEIAAAAYEFGTPADGIEIPEARTPEATAEYSYAFAGWQPEIAPVTGDAVYQAVYAAQKRSYTVRFLTAEGEELTAASYEYGTPVNRIQIPEAQAPEATAEYSYAFTGWEPAVSEVTGDAEYRAVNTATKRQYTVRFTGEDGQPLAEAAAYEYGTPAEDIRVPAAPQKEGNAEFTYTFAGWEPEIADVTGEAEYRAVYKAEKRSYMVRFLGADGEEIAAAVYEYGTPADGIEIPEAQAPEATAEYSYAFAGWQPEIAPVTGDASYQAVYAAQKQTYTVRFLDGTGAEIASATYEYGTAPEAMQIPEPQQTIETEESVYTFARWQPAVEPVTGDAAYQAAYSVAPRPYVLHFVDAGGNELAAVEYPYGTAADMIQAPQAPAMEPTAEEVMTFTGWEPEIADVTGEATYRAVYTAQPRPYTVRFLGDGGAVISEAVYPYGTEAEKILLPETAPEKPATAEFSYTFIGWEPEIVPVTGDATYQAAFNAEKNKVRIRWENDDGSEIDTTEVEYGEMPEHAPAQKEATPEFTYLFKNWHPTIKPAKEETAYRAVFDKAQRHYTVRFLNADGSQLTENSYRYGVQARNLKVPKAPEKAADEQYTYTFAGWEPELSDVTENMDYRPTYRETLRQYEVRFVNDDGRVVSAASYDYGTAAADVAIPGAPEKAPTQESTFTFTGWEPEIADVTGEAEYRAVYEAEKRSYTVRFLNADGEEIAAAVYEYGTPADGIEIPEAQAPEATAEYSYTFAGWQPEIAPVTGDVEYRAVNTATKRRYTLRFTDEDGEPLIEDAQYEYGTPAEAVKGPAIPQKEATAEFTYVFAGWDPAVENVTGDATYKATFEAVKNRYLVTWIPDNGAAPETQELEYGATPEHGPVAKEATAEYTYTFTGWEPEIAPVTGDAVYTAAYSAEKKTYLITWRDEDGTDLGIVEMEYGAEPVHAVGDKDPTDEFVYAFAGWQPEVKPVTEDAVYTAVYQKTKRSYTVTWLDAAGEPMERQTVEYGVTPVHDGPAKEETETEAYAFTSWDPEVAPVTGDAVYTPVYRTIRKITVKGADESFEYDGQPHSSNHAVVVSGELADGDTLAAETVGSVTEADQPCANTVDPKSVRVYRGEEDVTDEYRVTLELGHLTVTPRKLVITTGSAEKPYDGTPLTCTADIGIEGLAEGDQIAVQAVGNLTETGSAGNGFTIDWKKTRAANYEVVARPGTLTVTENPAEILLTAGSASKTYDGTELNENRITAEGLPAGFTVQVELSGGQTDVGTGVNTIEKWWILNAAGEDRTACFTGVKTAEGALEVTPRTLTVTTQDAGKEYDGQPLTAGTVTVEGLAEGESVTAVATGSLTDVGMAENTFEITWDGAAEANYLVNASCGTLTVVPSTREIVLTTGSATATYTGRPLRKGQILASGLPEGYRVKGTVTGSQTQAGASPNTMADNYMILDPDGEDRTEYFSNIRVEYGVLTVKPRRLTITTGSAEKDYDGDPIWNEEITVEGLVSGETVTVRTNGSQTDKGSSLNTYLILWDHAKASNYIIQEKLGRLTVK